MTSTFLPVVVLTWNNPGIFKRGSVYFQSFITGSHQLTRLSIYISDKGDLCFDGTMYITCILKHGSVIMFPAIQCIFTWWPY